MAFFIEQKTVCQTISLQLFNYCMKPLFKKIAEFTIILELNGYSDCLEIG